jgi:2-amino-4-hydroxy-6-hydroxymethyldihydropteridine diphosphokinase
LARANAAPSGAPAGSATDPPSSGFGEASSLSPGLGAAYPPTRVAIALGSNLGDRDASLRWAADALARLLDRLTVSSFIETAPVGIDEPQPWYLNAAASGMTRLPPRQLLDRLQSLERARGRIRTTPNAARTLDLDLILYGTAILDEPGLVIPHPRFRDRQFVLAPLAEIAGDMVDPVTRLTVSEMAARLRAGGASARPARLDSGKQQ